MVAIERELASPVHITSFYWLTLRQCTYYSDLWHGTRYYSDLWHSTQYRLYKTNGYEQFPEHIYYIHWVWKTIHVFPSFCVHTCLGRSCVRIPNNDLSWLRRYAPRCFVLITARNISYLFNSFLSLLSILNMFIYFLQLKKACILILCAHTYSWTLPVPVYYLQFCYQFVPTCIY